MRNFKYEGKTITILTFSGAVASGAVCVQEGFFGLATNTYALNDKGEIAVEGVYNVPVPASTVKGDLLYVPSSAGGVALTESNAPVLTRTSSNANAPVLAAIEDRRTDGTADCKILPRAASRSGTQV